MHHQVVSREDWPAARIALLAKEKELTRLSDEVARNRAPKGRSEKGIWWRRHDEYDEPSPRAHQSIHETGGQR